MKSKSITILATLIGLLIGNFSLAETGLKLGAGDPGIKLDPPLVPNSPLRSSVLLQSEAPSTSLGFRMSVDDFLEGKFSSGLGTSQKFVSRPCRDSNGKVQDEIVMMSETSRKINRAAACNEEINNKFYGMCDCAAYETCARSIMGIDNYFGFFNTPMYKDFIRPYIGEVTANKFQENMIKKFQPEIENRKVMRMYAKSMGVEIPDENSCELKAKSYKCDQDDFNTTVENLQKACNSKSSYNCYYLSDSSYVNAKVEEDERSTKFDKFLDANLVSRLSVDDKSIIAEISKHFLNPKKVPKRDLTNFISTLKTKLQALEKSGNLDPVFKLYLSDESKITDLYNTISNKMRENKKNSNETIAAIVNEAKIDEVKKFFSPENCKKAKSFRRICEIKAAIKDGKKSVIKPELDSDELRAIFNDDNFKKGFEDYTAANFYRAVQNENEFAAMVKGYRCFMLNYDNSAPKISLKGLCSEGGVDQNGSTSAFDPNPMGQDEDTRYGSTSADEVKRNAATSKDDKMDISVSETVSASAAPAVKKEGESSAEPTIEPASKEGLVSNQVANQLNNPIVNNPASNNFYNPNIGRTFTDSDEEDSDEAKKAKKEKGSGDEKSQIASYEERLRELTKKISATEDSIDKLKSGKKESESESARKEGDDQVRQLQAQLAAMKSELEATKAKARAVAVEARPVENTTVKSAQPTAFTSSSTTARDAVVEDRTNRPKKAETSDEASRDVGRSIATVGAPQVANNLPSGNNNGTATLKSSGLVLTRVDGMSSEAVVETINSKIVENQGQPFLIEEGGFVKEIIPVLKDGKIVLDGKGKPVFEKVIKGKVADMKAKGAKRAPASVGNSADLRRQEEERVKKEYDRMKYKKLKELTGEAVK